MPTTFETEITYAQAAVEGVREEMRRDPKVIYIGQGIGPRGGNFEQSRGLWEEFGDRRIKDTPLSESGTMGVGVGAAMAGYRPIVDIVWLDFMLDSMSQIVEQAATVAYTSNGRVRVPMVMRAAMGAIGGAGPHHSRCYYPWFVNVPGLYVVTPSTPADAKALIKTAIRDDNPVMFLDHAALVRTKGPVPHGEHALPFGQASIRRAGNDVSIVAVGLMVSKALDAAGTLARQGISAEVIDPRTLVPLDKHTILASVARTGRLVVVEEGPAACSFAAEIAALVGEEIFDSLRKPVKRVCALPIPHPFSPPLEAAMLPSAERIARAAAELI